MDAYEATRIVFSRIQSLDQENASKIMGLLLIQDHSEKEMIRLALGPAALVHSVILQARKELGLRCQGPCHRPCSWPPDLPERQRLFLAGGCQGVPEPEQRRIGHAFTLLHSRRRRLGGKWQPVQDVRIPCKEKRIFGFVTFMYMETMMLNLAKGNPHFVCNARVLVKPYKEKGKVPDKYRHSTFPLPNPIPF
ncbi:hypothetical protein COCNU_12G005760 [Cocos nucifera]|uniref:AtC3H46-like PABC-like domain-containing protein n=1 Tax=Cocos nucifera TaxID=13894 RepID=A0A8K0IS45_COCNU|nr:hypothetical protein COCNU_12G005760 [Cocos nucifera]